MVSFPAFSAVGTVMCANFSIIDDGIVEPLESFTVAGSGGNFVGGQDTIQVNILDSDGKEVWSPDSLFSKLCAQNYHKRCCDSSLFSRLLVYNFYSLIILSIETLFQFTLSSVQASEDVTTIEVCVELSSGIPSNDVTLTLDPSPGSASGEYSYMDHVYMIIYMLPLHDNSCWFWGHCDDNHFPSCFSIRHRDVCWF